MEFIEAMRAEWVQLINDIQMREDNALRHEGRPRLPFINCPATVGNDPCDDQDPDMDEDY